MENGIESLRIVQGYPNTKNTIQMIEDIAKHNDAFQPLFDGASYLTSKAATAASLRLCRKKPIINIPYFSKGNFIE